MKLVQASIRRSSEVLASVLKHAPSDDCAVAVVTPTKSKLNSNVPRAANPLPSILAPKTLIPTWYHKSTLASLSERSELREAAPRSATAERGRCPSPCGRCSPWGPPCRLEPQSQQIE